MDELNSLLPSYWPENGKITPRDAGHGPLFVAYEGDNFVACAAPSKGVPWLAKPNRVLDPQIANVLTKAISRVSPHAMDLQYKQQRHWERENPLGGDADETSFAESKAHPVVEFLVNSLPMNLASKVIGLNEDHASTLDAMKRRVHQRAISRGEDPDAAWREAEPTYRGMLGEPAQQQSMDQQDMEQARPGHEAAEAGKFSSIYDAAEAAMRSAGEGPARDKLQQIMSLTQELMQMHEGGRKRKTNLVESVIGN